MATSTQVKTGRLIQISEIVMGNRGKENMSGGHRPPVEARARWAMPTLLADDHRGAVGELRLAGGDDVGNRREIAAEDLDPATSLGARLDVANGVGLIPLDDEDLRYARVTDDRFHGDDGGLY